MADPMIGQKLGNFRIERLLGRGGMARVYYGVDTKLRRPVAIKIIDERYRKRPAEVKRFLKEAQLMAKWRHEHIAQIYYCGDENDLYYYVMEYIDGKDLASILESRASRNKALPVDEVLRIGSALAEALDYAHGQGVIHRDVKPSNVLIANNGRVVLCDFGLALDIQDGSLGEAFGTPHYISPEQALHSANAVPQSDLYSLGVILYEMLTGSVPFADASPTSAALQHIGQLPPPPRSLNPNLPVAAERVLLRALEKSPQRRYQSGAELMEALQKSLTAAPSIPVKPALPPIPVGVPTIRQSSLKLGGQREASKPRGRTTPLARPVMPHRALERPEQAPKRKRFPAGLLMLATLACLAGIIALWANGWIDPAALPWLNLPASPTAAQVQASPATVTPVIPAANTVAPGAAPSPSPQPAASRTPVLTAAASPTLPLPTDTPPAPTATASLPPSPTEPAAVSPTSAASASATAPGPRATATIKYPTGNRFTLFYDENSFYLYNRSTATRSVSGFSFERLGEDGQTREVFPGWMWSKYYENLPPERCMILHVYDSFPYMNPPECVRFLSLLNPERGSGLIFWTKQEGSRQFRVLWREEEVARCEISAGVCEFFTP